MGNPAKVFGVEMSGLTQFNIHLTFILKKVRLIPMT